MKFKYFKQLFFGFALVTVFASCDKFKDFGDTNVNPNGVTDPNTAFLLTNVLAGQGGVDFNAGYYCQYFTDPFYPGQPRYAFTTAGVGDFSGSLMDLQNIINYNNNPAVNGSPNVLGNGAPQNQIAICRIMKAYIIWRNTDGLGDIPYSEALKGQLGVFSPVYDRQEEIYKGMITELSEAVDQFDTDEQVPAMKGDIVYNGNRTKWKKFANSLRLLMALRLTKRYPSAAEYAAFQAGLALSHSAGVITDNADNFTINYPGGVYANPLSSETQSGLSKTFTDLLVGLNDGRMNVFGARAFNPPNNNISSNQGIPYGLDETDGRAFTTANPNYARILLASYRQANSPMVVIGAAHVLLAKAEVFQRGWVSDPTVTAADLYTQGIEASFQQWNVGAPALRNAAFNSGTGVDQIGVNTYGSIPDSSNAVTNTPLERIQLQQYIAWFPNGFQAWSNWRRTGVPRILPPTTALNSGAGIPRRYAYSQAQYNTNAVNVGEAVTRLPGGANTQDARMWWDQ